MSDEVSRSLWEGERLLWRSSTARRRRRRELLAAQAIGHVSFTLITLGGMALYYEVPLGSVPLKLALGLGSCILLNLVLAVYCAVLRRKMGEQGRQTFFLTDKRVGIINADGGVRQLPLAAHPVVTWDESGADFRLPEHAPIRITGMSPSERQLVRHALENLSVLQSEQPPTEHEGGPLGGTHVTKSQPGGEEPGHGN